MREWDMLLDTAQLRAFVTVVETRSFSKAAQRLHRVQSAVSQQIRRLEDQVGADLFVRERAGLKLTRKGEVLLAYAQRMLSANDAAVAALGKTTARHCLRVGTSDAYANSYFSSILLACAATFPDLEVELVCAYSSDIWARYEKGDLDLVLTQDCPTHIAGEVLHVESLRWACARDSLVYREETVPLALYTEGCADRDAALNALATAQKRFRLNYHSTSHAGILAALSSGRAISALLPSTICDDLRLLGEEDGFPALQKREITLAYRSDPAESAIHGFAQLVRKQLLSCATKFATVSDGRRN